MQSGIAEYVFFGAPLWLTGVGVFAAQAVALVLGSRERQSGPHAHAAGQSLRVGSGEGPVLSAALGLLALLLGFTFSVAITRHDLRRMRGVDEANAIDTTFHRAQELDEPRRSRMVGLIERYIDLRIAAARLGTGSIGGAGRAETEALQDAMWSEAAAVAHANPNAVSAALMSSVGQTIDLAAATKEARSAHVPTQVFTVLLTYMIIAAGLLGHAAGGRRRLAAAVYLLLVTMAFVLVLNIDDPARGSIRESMQPYEDVQVAMHRATP